MGAMIGAAVSGALKDKRKRQAGLKNRPVGCVVLFLVKFYALLGHEKFFPLYVVFRNQWRHSCGFIVLVQGYQHKESPVDGISQTVASFHVSIHPYFHGSASRISEISYENHQIIHICS